MRSTVTRLLVGGFLAPEAVGPGERVVLNDWLPRVMALEPLAVWKVDK